MKKQKLKEKGSYYYEEKEWYENCPDTLPETPKYKVEIFPKVMTHREILDTYKIVPYSSYAEAAAVVVSLIPELKWSARVVYFKKNDVLYRFNAWRSDVGRLRVFVDEVDLGHEYDAPHGVCFSNGLSDTSDTSLSPSDSLTLERAIQVCKDAGLSVTKTY